MRFRENLELRTSRRPFFSLQNCDTAHGRHICVRRAWPFGLSCVQNAPSSLEHQDTAAGPVRCGNATIRGPGGGPFGGVPGVLFVACTQVRADFSAVTRVGYQQIGWGLQYQSCPGGRNLGLCGARMLPATWRALCEHPL